MALVFISVVSILFAVSAIWLYSSCGFKVMLLVCVLGFWLFLFRTLWRDLCMFLESSINECFVKRKGINVIVLVNIGEVGLLTILYIV